VTEWIRAMKAARKRGMDPPHLVTQGISFVSNVCPDPSSPLIPTPTSHWSGGGDVQYACSLCNTPCRGDVNVHFNPVMAYPYVLTCGQCQLKMS